MDNLQLTGYALLRWSFFNETREETIARMVAYGWSFEEAEYAYESWKIEKDR